MSSSAEARRSQRSECTSVDQEIQTSGRKCKLTPVLSHNAGVLEAEAKTKAQGWAIGAIERGRAGFKRVAQTINVPMLRRSQGMSLSRSAALTYSDRRGLAAVRRRVSVMVQEQPSYSRSAFLYSYLAE
jgi:hypothetical protein